MTITREFLKTIKCRWKFSYKR